MNFFIRLLIVFLICLNISFSVATENNDVQMFVDFARFRYDAENTYLEIYYLFYPNQQQEVQHGDQQVLEVSLWDTQKDSLVAYSDFNIDVTGATAQGEAASDIKGGLIKRVIPTGDYLIKVVCYESGKSEKVDSLFYEFKAPSFEQDKIAISDIELSSKIITRSKNKESAFYKNTMEVYPNPTKMFGVESPVLFYYVELYNTRSERPEDKLQIEAVIADTDGNIRAKKIYERNRQHESLVEFGHFNVSKLEDGLYSLIFAVTDSASEYSVYNRNDFYMNNPNIVNADKEEMMRKFRQSEFYTLPEAELDKRFGPVQYLASKREIAIYDRMDDVDAKRMYLYKFWQEKEKQNPGISERYYERVEEANQKFGFANIPGWQSDRGRVYILYGEPDKISRNPYSADTRPYEVWFYYELEGGVKFLFIDETGFNDYRLKTSTLRGELYDPEYDQILRQEQ